MRVAEAPAALQAAVWLAEVPGSAARRVAWEGATGMGAPLPARECSAVAACSEATVATVAAMAGSAAGSAAALAAVKVDSVGRSAVVAGTGCTPAGRQPRAVSAHRS